MSYNVFMDQIVEYLKKRASSTVLVAYSVFWCICHWEALCTLLFTDQKLIMEKYGLLKNEYLRRYFLGLRMPTNFGEGIYLLISFVMPFVLAYIYVWWLPKFIINPCYRKEKEYWVQRKIIKLEFERKATDAETKIMRAKTQRSKAETQLAKAKQVESQVSPESVWKEDLDTFRRGYEDWNYILAQLKNTVYAHYGNISSNIGEKSLLVCDVNGLIEFQNNRTTVSLTPKGKFFLKETTKDAPTK